MTNSKFIVFPKVYLHTYQKLRGMGNQIVVGTVVKSKLGELGEEVRKGSSRKMRKDFTDVVQRVSVKKRFLLRFQDVCKNNI